MSDWLASADIDYSRFDNAINLMQRKGDTLARELQKSLGKISVGIDMTGLQNVIKKINNLNGLENLNHTFEKIDITLDKINTNLDQQINKEKKLNEILKDRANISQRDQGNKGKGSSPNLPAAIPDKDLGGSQLGEIVDIQKVLDATKAVSTDSGLPRAKVDNASSNFLKNLDDFDKLLADIKQYGFNIGEILGTSGGFEKISKGFSSDTGFNDLLQGLRNLVENDNLLELMAWVRDIYSAQHKIQSVIDLQFAIDNPSESRVHVKKLRGENIKTQTEFALAQYITLLEKIEAIGLSSDLFNDIDFDDLFSNLGNASAGNKGTLSAYKSRLNTFSTEMKKLLRENESEEQAVQNMQKQQQNITKLKLEYDQLMRSLSTLLRSQGVTDIDSLLKEQKAFFDITDDELKKITSTSSREDVDKVNDTLIALRAVFANLSNLNKESKNIDKTRIDEIIKNEKILQIQDAYSAYNLGKTALGKSGSAGKYQLSSDVIGFDINQAELAKRSLKELEIVLREIKRVNKQVQTDLKETGSSSLREFGERIKKITAWTVSVYAVQTGTKLLRQGWQEIVKTETALVNLNKVMDLSTRDLDKMSDAAFNLGKQYGFLGTEVLQATEIFAKQFKDVGDVSRLTEVALLASNVGEMTTDQAGKYITAAMNQYNIGIDSAVTILDKWNEVSNRNAVTTVDLAEAMSQTGAAAKLAGIDMDRLNGMVAALAQATAKSGSEIGSTLKFMFSRARTDATIAGFQSVGISAMETADTYRKLSDVFDELSFKWDTLSEKEKTTVAKAMGGRRYADFIVLMDNYDKALKAQTDSLASLGSAEREDQKVMQSTMKIMKQLGAATGKLAVEIGNSGILETIKVSIQGLTNVISVVSLLPAPLLNATMALTIFSIASKKGLIALTALSGGMNVLLALIAGAGVWTIGKLISTQEHEIDVANERIKVLDQELERKRNMIELNKQLSIPEKEQVIDELNIANIKAKTEELEKLIKRRDYLFEQAKSLPESSKTRVLLEKDVLDLTNVISNLEIQIQSAMPKLQATLAEYMSMDLWGKLEIWQEDIEETNKKLKDDLNRLNLAFKAGGLSIGEYYGLLAQLENKDHFAKLRESVLELNDTLKNDTAKAFESAFGDLFSGKKDWLQTFKDAIKNMNVQLGAKMAADWVMSGSYMRETMLGSQVGLGTLASNMFGLKKDLEHLKWNEKYETKIASAETAMANWGERKESKSLEKIIEDFNDNVEVLQYFNADMKIDQNQLQGLLDSLKKTNKEAWDALIAEWSKKDTIVVGGAKVQVNSEGKIISFNGQVVMKVDGELLKDMLISNEVSPNRVRGLTEAQAIEYMDYMVLGKDQIGDLWTFLDEQGHLSNKTHNALSNLMSYVGTEQRLFDFIANPTRSTKDLFGEEQWKVIEQAEETDLARELVVRAVRAYEQQLPEELKRLLGKDFFSGFSSGGYTGSGGKFDVAGLVHKEEYVIPEWVVKHYPELVAQIEKLRTGKGLKGFDKGGYTGTRYIESLKGQEYLVLDKPNFSDIEAQIMKYQNFIQELGEKVLHNIFYNRKTGEGTLESMNKIGETAKDIYHVTDEEEKKAEERRQKDREVMVNQVAQGASKVLINELLGSVLVNSVSEGFKIGWDGVLGALNTMSSGKEWTKDTYYGLVRQAQDSMGDSLIGKIGSVLLGGAGDYGYKQMQATQMFQYMGLAGTVASLFDMDLKRSIKVSLEDLLPNLIKGMFGLSGGGYTGSGGKFQPAGIVHKGEYVIPKWMVQRNPALIGTLEQFRLRGYTSGGSVESGITVASGEGDIVGLLRSIEKNTKPIGLRIQMNEQLYNSILDNMPEPNEELQAILEAQNPLVNFDAPAVDLSMLRGGKVEDGVYNFLYSMATLESKIAEVQSTFDNPGQFFDPTAILSSAIQKNPEIAKYLTPQSMTQFAQAAYGAVSSINPESMQKLVNIVVDRFTDTLVEGGLELDKAMELTREIWDIEVLDGISSPFNIMEIAQKYPHKIKDMLAGAMDMYAQSDGAGLATIFGAIAGGVSGTNLEANVLKWFEGLGITADSGVSALKGAGQLATVVGGLVANQFGIGEKSDSLYSMIFGGIGQVFGGQAGGSMGNMVGSLLDNWIGGTKEEIDKEIRSAPWQKTISTPDYFAMEDRFYLSGRYASLLDGRSLERRLSSLENAIKENTESQDMLNDKDFTHSETVVYNGKTSTNMYSEPLARGYRA